MDNDIYDPLAEYVNVFRNRFKQVAESTFEELAVEAGVDVNANRKTCSQLYDSMEQWDGIKHRCRMWQAARVVLWIIIIACGAVVMFCREITPWMGISIGVACVASLVLILVKANPEIETLKAASADLERTAKKLKKEAWAQMHTLNGLYDWDLFTRMMMKTVPKLEFDPYFTTKRLADLKMTYGWDDSFNEDRSVVYSHSGLINGNPFVICRTRKMVMGTKTYNGEKTIYWTTSERGSDGKYHTVRHSETLHASVTAPYPLYEEATRLIYGNTAAPDLIFDRRKSGLANEEGSLRYKLKRRSLRKKARDLEREDFVMLTNEEFEVAFNTSNRNNNQQFALLFTPLAQENMLKLLKDTSAGYGDDFDFYKDGMINVIVPDHLQSLDLEMNPSQYLHFDYDKAKRNFYAINAGYFRAVYFSLAPLLCVPMYQQIRSRQDIYGYDMPSHSSFWEHEALANFWGKDHFKAPGCVTDCILKTRQKKLQRTVRSLQFMPMVSVRKHSSLMSLEWEVTDVHMRCLFIGTSTSR